MVFLLSEFGLSYDTLALVVPVIKLLPGNAILFLFFLCYGVKHHFTGLLEKVHRTSKYLRNVRLQVAVNLSKSGIQF